jgi:hypothetical protein
MNFLLTTLPCNAENLKWCNKIKLSDLVLPRKSGTIKSLQQWGKYLMAIGRPHVLLKLLQLRNLSERRKIINNYLVVLIDNHLILINYQLIPSGYEVLESQASFE